MPPEQKTTVVSDTTSYLPAELVERHGIELVSLYVGVEGRLEREIDVIDYAGFFERLRASDRAVTTSQASIGDFLSAYEPLLAEGREIVSIHLSAAVSGTYDSALAAREQLISERKGGERIHVLDSRTTAGGMGLVVLAAARAAEGGASGADALAAAQRVREGLKIWFAVDTLEFLRRGDRIGGARAWLGTTLKIKPILTFEEEIVPIERVRTRGRSIERLIDYGRQLAAEGSNAWVVQHIQDPDAATRLVADSTAIFGCEPVFVSEIGPVIGAHVGPGLLGIGGAPAASIEPGPAA